MARGSNLSNKYKEKKKEVPTKYGAACAPWLMSRAVVSAVSASNGSVSRVVWHQVAVGGGDVGYRTLRKEFKSGYEASVGLMDRGPASKCFDILEVK